MSLAVRWKHVRQPSCMVSNGKTREALARCYAATRSTFEGESKRSRWGRMKRGVEEMMDGWLNLGIGRV